MSISADRPAVHNPELCGLDLAGRPLCPACAPYRPPAVPIDPLVAWDRLRERHWRQLRSAPRAPAPLSAQELERLAWALVEPGSWAVLADALLALLADTIADIALAVVEAVRQ